VIGAVAALREKLDWFQRLPLFGQTVLVTRAAEQAGELSVKLHDLGARVIEWPTIALCPPANHGPIDAAIAELESFDWVLFTSANGVRFFMERLERSPKDLRALRGKLCAIGPATKAALERLHLKVDLMPAQYVAESVVAAFTEVGVKGKRILLPRAAVARDVIPRELGHLGATVEVVEAYRTVAPPEASLPLPVKPDWATFTSSSTVKNFTEAQGVAALSGVRIATIGPITSQTAREAGLAVDAEGSPYTIEGMLAALVGRRSTLS
jgi:uroporphyrinogen III methyltransferase/synthase